MFSQLLASAAPRLRVAYGGTRVVPRSSGRGGGLRRAGRRGRGVVTTGYRRAWGRSGAKKTSHKTTQNSRKRKFRSSPAAPVHAQLRKKFTP